jgi:ribosomal protein L6P/L9E
MLYFKTFKYKFLLIKKNYYNFIYLFFFFNFGFLKLKLSSNLISFFFKKKKIIFFSKYFEIKNIFSNFNNILNFFISNFNNQLFLKGISYKLKKNKNKLYMVFGFNHILVLKIPLYINIFIKLKIIKISGLKSYIINSIIYKILNLKKFNLYKFKGICFKNTILKKK